MPSRNGRKKLKNGRKKAKNGRKRNDKALSAVAITDELSILLTGSPVDVAAKEIVEGDYHAIPRPLLQIFKEWNQGEIPIRTVSDEAFIETIRIPLC